MARLHRFASVSLCLCLSMALAAPVQASPHARTSLAGLSATASPSGRMNAPSPNPNKASEATPNTTPGIRFAPTGSRWLQPLVRVHYEATDPEAPTTPFLVVRSATGGAPIVLAVTPPGEGLPPPSPRQRRLTPKTFFAVGLAMFTVGYVASGLTAVYVRRHCVEDGQATCVRRAGTLMVPVAGPFLVASQTRDPRDYALGVVQGAGLLLAVIGGIFALTEHHQRAVDERGIRLSRNTRLRPESGPAGAQLTIDARF